MSEDTFNMMIDDINSRDFKSNDGFDNKEEARKKLTDYYLHEFFTVDGVIEKLDYSRSDLDLDEDADKRTFALESLRQYHKDQ